MHSINWRESRRFIFIENVWNKNALQTRHVAFKSKIQWYLAKQMTKVSNRIQTNFTICHEKSKDIEISLISIFNNNYIQLYKRNMTWATLHPIWYFRVWNPYDSSHVQQIKKERHLDCNILWMDTRSFFIFSLTSFFTHCFAF